MPKKETVKKQSGLYGLFLAGGQSKRMGREKATLKYHGLSQADHYSALLAKFCEKVFLSCREDQRHVFAAPMYPLIYDRKKYADCGPLGGMLSAMARHPRVSWIVL